MDILAAARAEVIARHAFFVGWFRGKLPDAAMAAAERVFAPDMRMIPPDGTVLHRADVMAMLQAARNTRTAGFVIEVDVREARMLGDMALVIYDEHQVIEGVKTARRSSALFSVDEGAPEGVVWRHVHETWITKT